MPLEITGLKLDKLPEQPIEEHAPEIVELCELIKPAFMRFEAKLKLYLPRDAELERRADYEQLSSRTLKQATNNCFPNAVAK